MELQVLARNHIIFLGIVFVSDKYFSFLDYVYLDIFYLQVFPSILNDRYYNVYYVIGMYPDLSWNMKSTGTSITKHRLTTKLCYVPTYLMFCLFDIA